MHNVQGMVQIIKYRETEHTRIGHLDQETNFRPPASQAGLLTFPDRRADLPRLAY